MHKDSRGNWTPRYEGTYIINKSFSRGAMFLTTMGGEELTHYVNSNTVKKYYA